MRAGKVLVALFSVSLSCPGVDLPAQGVEGTVVVVRSAATDAAREATRGLRERLAERGVSVSQELQVTPGAPSLGALRDKGVDVVVALGAEAVESARSELPGTVVVSALVLLAEARGAGVSLDVPVDVQLQWIRRLLPANARRVGVIYSRGENERAVAHITEAARAHQIEIVGRPVAGPAEIPAALNSLTSAADVLWAVPDDVVITTETARSILLFSMRNRLPLIGLSQAWVKAGALFALDRDYADIGAQLADQVLRLLKGEAAASVRAETPRRVVYTVNQRTAELMGMRLPAEALRNAREVIR
jgi:putative ABC transport system substrate-binding protein